MIHLGYLAYDQNRRRAFVPNEEIRQELSKAVRRKHWNEMAAFSRDSEELLEATLDLDAQAVAKGIEKSIGNMLLLFNITMKILLVVFLRLAI